MSKKKKHIDLEREVKITKCPNCGQTISIGEGLQQCSKCLNMYDSHYDYNDFWG